MNNQQNFATADELLNQLGINRASTNTSDCTEKMISNLFFPNQSAVRVAIRTTKLVLTAKFYNRQLTLFIPQTLGLYKVREGTAAIGTRS